MKKLMIVMLAAMSFAAVGCKKKGGQAEAMAKMTDFKNRMCECKDNACATKVSDEMAKWGKEQTDNNKGESPKLSDEDQKKFSQVSEDMGKCMQKAMGGGDMAGSAAMMGSADGSGAMMGSGAMGSGAMGSGAMMGSAQGSAMAGSAAPSMK
ncbi:hypothetical protein BH11MYX1_BH11MYX1_17870 [soil metagenome]